MVPLFRKKDKGTPAKSHSSTNATPPPLPRRPDSSSGSADDPGSDGMFAGMSLATPSPDVPPPDTGEADKSAFTFLNDSAVVTSENSSHSHSVVGALTGAAEANDAPPPFENDSDTDDGSSERSKPSAFEFISGSPEVHPAEHELESNPFEATLGDPPPRDTSLIVSPDRKESDVAEPQSPRFPTSTPHRSLISTPRKKKRTIRKPGYLREDSEIVSMAAASREASVGSGVHSATEDITIMEPMTAEKRREKKAEPVEISEPDKSPVKVAAVPPVPPRPVTPQRVIEETSSGKKTPQATKVVPEKREKPPKVNKPKGKSKEEKMGAENVVEKIPEASSPPPSFLETAVEDPPPYRPVELPPKESESKGNVGIVKREEDVPVDPIFIVNRKMRSIIAETDQERTLLRARQRAVQKALLSTRKDRIDTWRELVEVRVEERRTEQLQMDAVEADNFQQAQTLDDQLSALRSRRVALSTRASSTASKLEGLESQNCDLQQDLVRCVERRVERLQEVHREHAEKVEEINRARKAALDEEMEKQSAELERVERSLSHVALDRQMVESSLVAIVTQVRTQTSKEQGELSTLQTRVAELDEEIQELEQTLIRKKEVRDRSAARIAEISARVGAVESKFTKERTRLERELNNIESQSRELESQQQRTQDKSSEISRELLNIESEVGAGTSRELRSVDLAISQAQGLSRTLARRRTTLLTTLSEHRQAGVAYAEQEQAVAELRDASEQCRADVDAVQARTLQEASQVSEANAQLAQISSALPALQADKQRAVAGRNFREAGRINAEVKSLEEKRSELTATLEAAQIHLETDSARVDTLQKELAMRREKEEAAEARLELDIIEMMKLRRKEVRQSLRALQLRRGVAAAGGDDVEVSSGEEDEESLRQESKGCATVILSLGGSGDLSQSSDESDGEVEQEVVVVGKPKLEVDEEEKSPADSPNELKDDGEILEEDEVPKEGDERTDEPHVEDVQEAMETVGSGDDCMEDAHDEDVPVSDSLDKEFTQLCEHILELESRLEHAVASEAFEECEEIDSELQSAQTRKVELQQEGAKLIEGISSTEESAINDDEEVVQEGAEPGDVDTVDKTP